MICGKAGSLNLAANKGMVLDLELAQYKLMKFPERVTKPSFPARRPVHMSLRHRSDLDAIVSRMRHDTWRRSEQFNKQLQHFIDRKRFQQNHTWQMESDRLRDYYSRNPFGERGHSAVHVGAIDDRMDELRQLIVAK
jgi:hypothetical protein